MGGSLMEIKQRGSHLARMFLAKKKYSFLRLAYISFIIGAFASAIISLFSGKVLQLFLLFRNLSPGFLIKVVRRRVSLMIPCSIDSFFYRCSILITLDLY
jgi:hypothetical protein